MTAEQEITSALDADDQVLLQTFVGKRLIAFAQAPNRGNFNDGDWQDDEPLHLTFEDGSVLVVWCRGWHDSGGLYVGAG